MNLKRIRKNNCEWHLIGAALGITMFALVLLAGSVGGVPYAYITNFDSDTVSVIDTVTKKVIDTISVGDGPYGVAVNPEGTKVYVTNSNGNTVSVINTVTNKVINTVAIGTRPTGIAVNPAGTKIYVATKADAIDSSGMISVIDTATDDVIDALPAINPDGVAVNPEGTKVYITDTQYFPNSDVNVSVIDTATKKVIDTIIPSGLPIGIVVNPSGTKVYVSNLEVNPGYPGTVSVIDTATNEFIDIPVEVNPRGVAVNPKGTMVYVTNDNSNTVSVINTVTNKVIYTVPVGNGPRGVAVNPAGTEVYVVNSNSNTVSVIDTTKNTVILSLNVGNHPIAFGQFIGPEVNQTPILSVTATPISVPVGTTTSVTFSVTSGGTAVSGANVVLSGSATGGRTTDDFGNAVISVKATAAGTITANASKTGYTIANVSVTAIAVTTTTPTVTIIPTPTVTIIPTPTVTIIPTPTVTIIPTPTVTITPTPTVTIIPTPTVTTTPTGQNTFKVALTSDPSSIESGQTSTIIVTVTGSNGTGIPDASVMLDSIPAGKFDPASGTTNPFGRFTSTFTAPAKGNAAIEALVTKEGFADIKENLQLAASSETQPPSSLYIILILIVILILVTSYLWIKGDLKLAPGQTSIPCDGKSTLPVKVQFVNAFGKPGMQKKDREIKMETSSGTIQSVIIPAGKEFIEATLISSTECGPVMITATSGKQKRSAQVNFVSKEAHLDLEISPANIPADGKSTATVIIRIKDDKGNYITSLNERIVEMTTAIGTITGQVKIPPRSQAGIATITSGQISGTAKIIASCSSKGEGRALYGEGKVVFAELAKTYCHRDGTQIAMDAPVCPTCNKNPLLDDTDTKQCRNPKCKTVIPQSANFCHKCGNAQQ